MRNKNQFGEKEVFKKGRFLIILSLSVFFGVVLSGMASADTTFNSTWNTSATSTGSSNLTSVSLPLESGGVYDFTVNWETI